MTTRIHLADPDDRTENWADIKAPETKVSGAIFFGLNRSLVMFMRGFFDHLTAGDRTLEVMGMEELMRQLGIR